MGLRVCQFQLFQEDQIAYLVQSINFRLEWCHLSIRGERILFVET